VGIEVDLDSVHVRESGMTAPELLMSESQERMMAFVAPDLVEEVLAVASKWEIDSAVVGEVRPGETLTVRHDGRVVAEVPAASLADDAPLYDRPMRRPDWIDPMWAKPADAIEEESSAVLLRLLDDPALGSTAWVHEQYDHMLFLNTVLGPGGDGSLIRVRGTNKALAVSTDGNGRLCHLDPRAGAARLVYEAGLNVAVTGARPMAVVDNLNFGNPEKPEVMWQFRESVEGISEACEALGVPVVGGNVSFYNETDGGDIHPTPVVGMLGLADPMPDPPARLSRAAPGMEIWVVGPAPSANLAGSAAQRVMQGSLTGRPTVPDPEMAKRVIAAAAELAHTVPVLHDISDGGLAVAVAEVCIAAGVGATIEDIDTGLLFSEDPHRFVAVLAPGSVDLPQGLARRVGVIGGQTLTLGRSEPIALDLLVETHRNAIPRRMAAV
jgi:phosphoribosylformylglycinamidine synthase